MALPHIVKKNEKTNLQRLGRGISKGQQTEPAREVHRNLRVGEASGAE